MGPSRALREPDEETASTGQGALTGRLPDPQQTDTEVCVQQTTFCLPLPSPRIQVKGPQPRPFHQGVGTVPKLSQQTSQEFSTFDLRDPTKAFRIKPRAVGWLPLPPPGRSAVCPETVDTGSNSSPFLLGAESPACPDAKREAATEDLQRSCCVHLEAWGVI